MSPDLISLSAVVAGACAGTVIDLRLRRVPNGLTLPLAGFGLLLAAGSFGSIGIGAAVMGCVLGLALMLPGHLLGATGAGDVKLLAAMGTLLGPAGTLRAFVFTMMAGGVLALLVAAHRGRLAATFSGPLALARHAGPDNRFAYAPAIAVGALSAAVFA